MTNPYDEPTEECPYCKNDMHANFVDVGIGVAQCGPYHCEACGASEVGPEMDDWFYKDRNGNILTLMGKRKYIPRMNRKIRIYGHAILRHGHPFTEKEIETGYYQGKHSPYANTVGGMLVNDKIAKLAYEVGVLDEKPTNQKDNERTNRI